jgi:beta-glucanase (GH16 family)
VPDAFEIKDGILRIKAERRDANYGGKLRHVISGMMTTYQKFSQQFGRFDIRCRAPRGKGLWPAFWLLPDPLGWPPEIDVLEVLGQNTKTVYFTHHWKDAAGKLQSDHGRWPPDWKITSRGVRGPFESKDDFAAGFHEISCQWSADDIRWSIDGAERFRSTKSIPRGKMYLLLNLAVGGDWPGAPDERTPFPSALEVDWVRCYEKAPAGGK